MLNIAFFSSKSYHEKSFELAKGKLDAEFHFHDFRLTTTTAKMAHDNEVVCKLLALFSLPMFFSANATL